MARNEEGKPLSDKDRRFCEEYVGNGYNASRAYTTTHPDCTAQSAQNSGYRLLKDARIKAYIKDLEADIYEANHINAEHIANELAGIAFGVVSDESRLSYADKMKALELLGKQINLYTNKLDVALKDIVINIKGEDANDG